MNWKFWTWQWPRKARNRLRIPHRRGWWTWLVSRTFLYDALVALFVCLGGLANGLRAATAQEIAPARLWYATAIGGLVFSIVRAVVTLREAYGIESTHELFGCLHVLHGQLVGDDTGSNRLRVTLYVPLPRQTALQQIVEYVGEDGDVQYKSGRTMSVHVGIVGRAYRTKQFVIAYRQSADADAFRAELIKDWAYTEEGAQEIDQESRSWLAVPIVLENEDFVQAILFADSTQPNFFNEDHMKIVFGACAGIATFVARRYK